ncbi:S1 family peptidase [Nocardia suismassiliense]|uniref:S1 family peptidase n=1 Tax=Nocardia suismassiliense TaxID=2077092 RepID=UPI001F21A46E|nr:S1 family peptidase [Nocardia suismassiliense]
MVALGRFGIHLALFAVTMTCTVIGVPGVAAAVPTASLGGGSGILLGRAACTLTTIGYDNTDRLVGLTAGHCAEIGMSVRAERMPDAGIVGTVAAVDHQDDYAVLEFDRTKVVPVRQVAATVIGGIGTPPQQGDVVCKNGRTSGYNCGIVWDTHRWWFQNQSCSQPGDSGGPVTIGDRLVGMNVGHMGVQMVGVTVFDMVCHPPAVPFHDPAVATQIGMVLDDIDQAGGVGSGFRPL